MKREVSTKVSTSSRGRTYLRRQSRRIRRSTWPSAWLAKPGKAVRFLRPFTEFMHDQRPQRRQVVADGVAGVRYRA